MSQKYSVDLRMEIVSCDDDGTNRVGTGHRLKFEPVPAEFEQAFQGWLMMIRQLTNVCVAEEDVRSLTRDAVES